MPATTGRASPSGSCFRSRSWRWRERRTSPRRRRGARALARPLRLRMGVRLRAASRCPTVERRARLDPPSAAGNRSRLPAPAVPAGGGLGRLGRVGPAAVAADACARHYHARPDRSASTASRRAACSAGWTGRRWKSASSRATPRIPAAAGATARRDPATLNQVNDPDRILYPLKRAGRRGEGQLDARRPGTRRSTTSAGASARRSRRGGRTRSCTTSAARVTTA